MFKSTFAKLSTVFKELDEAMDTMSDEMDQLGRGIATTKFDTEKETVVEETKPDGTKTVTRTIVRTIGKGT